MQSVPVPAKKGSMGLCLSLQGKAQWSSQQALLGTCQNHDAKMMKISCLVHLCKIGFKCQVFKIKLSNLYCRITVLQLSDKFNNQLRLENRGNTGTSHGTFNNLEWYAKHSDDLMPGFSMCP